VDIISCWWLVGSSWLLVSGCWFLVAVESVLLEVPMTRWCFLVAFFVVSAFGQSPQNAVDPTRITREAVQAILGASLGQGMPVSNVMRFSVDGLRESSCSVPLIEVQIPKDTEFVIAQVRPPGNFSDKMPVAHGLPACPTGDSR
jgi:hypothetical protein